MDARALDAVLVGEQAARPERARELQSERAHPLASQVLGALDSRRHVDDHVAEEEGPVGEHGDADEALVAPATERHVHGQDDLRDVELGEPRGKVERLQRHGDQIDARRLDRAVDQRTRAIQVVDAG